MFEISNKKTTHSDQPVTNCFALFLLVAHTRTNCELCRYFYGDSIAPASAPPSTTSEPHQMSLSDVRLSASTHQLSKSTSVTPTGSLLSVHNTVQLRESTLTVNYPDTGIGEYHIFNIDLYFLKVQK